MPLTYKTIVFIANLKKKNSFCLNAILLNLFATLNKDLTFLIEIKKIIFNRLERNGVDGSLE